MVVLSERRLETGVAESVPDKVDVELAVIAVPIVEKPIGETVPEDVRMDVVWVSPTELAALIVPERLYTGLVCESLDDVPDREGCHLVGLP